jgi:Ca2+ transporting ATPase
MHLFFQIILVEFSGYAFRCESLNAQQWMWCLFLGFTELLIGQVVATIPKGIFSKDLCRIGRGSIPQTSNARLLWIRSVTRLRHQVSHYIERSV